MVVNNLFSLFSPVQSRALELRKQTQGEMQKLAAGNREIEQARARAEVAFRQAERHAHWEEQRLDLSRWQPSGPAGELPSYWSAGVRFVATTALAYALAAAKAINEPKYFEKLLNYFVSVLAEQTYNGRLNRYAKVSYSGVDRVLDAFTRAVRSELKEPFSDLQLAAWRRYEAQLNSDPPPQGKLPVEGQPTAEMDGSTSGADSSPAAAAGSGGMPSPQPGTPDVVATRREDLEEQIQSELSGPSTEAMNLMCNPGLIVPQTSEEENVQVRGSATQVAGDAPEPDRSDRRGVVPQDGAIPGAVAPVDTASAEDQNRRALVDSFIQRCLEETREHVTRAMIWRSAGYKKRCEFERWQSNSPKATKKAAENFMRILSMSPCEFVELLKKQKLLK
jgi:hypothetical protein